jgi:hypothetical protein
MSKNMPSKKPAEESSSAEEGSDIFLRNIGLSPNYRTSQPRDRIAHLSNRPISKIDSYFLQNTSHFQYKVLSVNDREAVSVVRPIRNP